MMRRISLLALTLAAAAACAPTYGGGGYGTGGPTPEYPEEYLDGTPLDARLYDDFGRLRIRLNRPAHVAIFEIVPGRGVGMMYPAFRHEAQFLAAGNTRLHLSAPRRYDWYFASYDRALEVGPRFYFLVASEAPLRIARFQRSQGALRSVLGLDSYASIDANTVMDDLIRAIVPPQEDLAWSADVLAVWPEEYDYDDYYGSYGDYLVQVACDDGYVVTVPVELAAFACRAGRNDEPRPPHHRPPSDTTKGRDSLNVPGRRRPEPRIPASIDSTAPTGTRPTPARGGAEIPQDRRRPETGDGPRVGQPGSERPRVAPRAPEGSAPVQPQRDEDAARVAPRVVPRREEPRTETPREEPRREEPRAELPREAPRREEPRAEVPREAPRREEPRAEAPRVEPRREEPRAEPPRAEPRPEPRREEPARVEPRRADPPPAPRNDPPPAPRNDPPPAPRNDPPPAPRNDPPPAPRNDPPPAPRADPPSRPAERPAPAPREGGTGRP